MIPHWKPEEQAHGYQDGDDWGTVRGTARSGWSVLESARKRRNAVDLARDDAFLPNAMERHIFAESGERENVSAGGPLALAGSNGIFFFVYTYDPAERVAAIVASTDSAMPGDM